MITIEKDVKSSSTFSAASFAWEKISMLDSIKSLQYLSFKQTELNYQFGYLCHWENDGEVKERRPEIRDKKAIQEENKEKKERKSKRKKGKKEKGKWRKRMNPHYRSYVG